MSKEQNLHQDENRNNHITKRVFTESLHLLFYLIVVFLSTYLILHYIGQRTQVLGQSMEKTLTNQDNLIVDKLTYHFMKPNRYDIVVFPVDESANVFYIKRIIGLPGETVQIIDGYMSITKNYMKTTAAKLFLPTGQE